VLTFTVTTVVERSDASARSRVQAADAFFLAVESPATPQNVGGVALLDTSVRAVTRQDLVDMVASHLDELPRFRQRLSRHTRWRRPSWEDHPMLDWDWHVPVRRLPDPGGMDRLWDVVAGIQAEPLPLDRPLWRLFLIENVAPGTTAVVLITHHVVADGVGVVAQALRLMEPVEAVPAAAPEAPVAPPTAGPGALRTAAGIVAGIARLATDGRQDVRLPSGHTAERRFAGCDVPFEPVIRLARSYGVRISDVILCAFAGGLYRVWRRPSGAAGPALCRVAVPLTMRAPGTSAEGNVTAAVMADLPVDARSEPDRLADIAARRRRLHTGSRALAARFVMRRLGRLMPPPLHTMFARAVYGRRTFQAIVSNLPGPKTTLTMAGAVLTGAFPILPLAPGAPLAVGALSWEGRLHVGISADPVLLEEPAALAAAMREVLAELTAGRDDR
jgi:WS/DGAT/MGAT family acyltransferase